MFHELIFHYTLSWPQVNYSRVLLDLTNLLRIIQHQLFHLRLPLSPLAQQKDRYQLVHRADVLPQQQTRFQGPPTYEPGQ